MNSLWRIAAFLLGILSAVALHARSIELTPGEQAFIQEHPVVVMGGDAAWEPMIIMAEGGTVSGFERDLLDRLEELTGLEFRIKTGTWEDIVSSARKREIDGLLYSSDQPERRSHFNFTQSYNRFKVGFYGLLSHPMIADISTLSGKKVGVQASDQFSNNYVDSLKGLQKVVFNTRNQMIEALLAGEVDLVFGALDFNYHLWKNSISGIKLVYLPRDKGFEAVYSIRKDWPELVSIFNKALESIGAGERLRLMNRWISLSEQKTTLLTQSDQFFIESHPKINVVTIEDWLPIVSVDQERRIGGWFGDYFRKINEHLGFQVNAIGTGDSTLIDSLAQLPNTVFVYPDLQSKKPRYRYSTPVLSIPFGLAMRRGAPFVNDLQYLGKVTLGVLSYNPHIEEIRKQYPRMEIKPVPNTREALDQVLNGELDGYIGSISTLNYHIQSQGYTELFIAGTLDIQTSLHFSSQNDELVELLEKTMRQVPEAEKQELVRSWYGAKPDVVDRRLAYQIAAISIVVLLVLAVWLISLGSQIKKRKRAQKILARNQANLVALIENTDAFIYSLDKDLKLIAKNTAFGRFMSTFTDRPLISGSYIGDFLPELYRDVWLERYQRALRGEKFTKEDSTSMLGAPRTFINHFNPIMQGKHVIGVACHTEDATDFTKLNRHMISLMDTSFDYLLIKDTEGKYVVASQSLARINGYDSWKQLVGKTDRQIHMDSAEIFELDDQKVLKEGKHSINKVQSFKDKNGTLRWVQTTKEPIHDQEGVIIGLSGVGRDITEQRHAEQEQRMLIQTVETSEDFISFANDRMELIYMNSYGQKILGLESYEGLHLQDILDPVTLKVVSNALKHKVSRGEQWHEEFEVMSPVSGERITFDNHIFAIRDQDDHILCYANVARDIRERNRLQEQVLEAKLTQKLMTASLKAEDQERSRIAHELHDGIQQKIAAVSIYLQSLDSNSENIKEVIQSSFTKLNETISDIRQMSNSLLPRALQNTGLAACIQDEVEGLRQNTPIAFNFHENIGSQRFSATLELNLYRIFQEAISNIIKHAAANEVEIQLIMSGLMLSLTIEDDGKGFDYAAKARTSIGLSSIRNRAEVIGGHVEIDSTPSQGTSILIEVQHHVQ